MVLDLETLSAATVLGALIMYAIFGGADFGGGIWIALASGPRARDQRESLFQAIGPVWETNHIWLILAIVCLLTALPRGFADLWTALFVPLVIALIGINFRGAAFAFWHYGERVRVRLPQMMTIFVVSSLLTPLTLAMAFAASGAGDIRIVNGQVESGLWSWVTPFTLVGGLIGIGICAFVTAVFMTMRTRGELNEDFRRRALVTALVLGVLTTMEIPIAYLDAPHFYARLVSSWAIILVIAAVACGTSVLTLLWARHYLAAEIMAGAAISATMGGYGAALYPYLIYGQLTIAEAAAPQSMLRAMLISLPIASLILIPSLWFLYWTFRGHPNPALPAEERTTRPET